ncbi:MAG: SUMF1/EgtB/PvdO family nonheme iron enzyme [Bacteroidia bacterium]|nr:SUMF1/EgtB/PvdO family nonheme iron enzyme [Bacteroidia bacterium]
MPTNPHILPLETLIELLRQEGFLLAPDQRVRVQQVLDLFAEKGKTHPADLRYFLRPIFAKDVEQQTRFDSAFDRWLKTIHEYDPAPEDKTTTGTTPEVIRREKRKWQIPALIAALLFVVLLILRFGPNDLPEKPAAFFTLTDPCVEAGRPFQPVNNSPDTTARYLWNFGDGQTDTARIPQPHIYITPGTYTVSLTAVSGELDSTYTQHIFVHAAKQRPRAAIAQEESGTIYTFRADTVVEEWDYQWAFNIGDSARGAEVVRQMEDNALHYATLTVSLPADTAGYCEAQATALIDLRQTLVQLREVPPYFESVGSRETRWRVWVWIAWPLLCLLLAAAYIALYRFRRRPPDHAAMQRAFQGSDGPPVLLPFPPQDEIITSEGEMRTLAQTLRRRETGERRELDLDTTLRQTIQNGGFPVLEYRYPSRPVEYLALIQTQGPDDQQARLFARLLEILRGEQVPIEVWYFQGDLGHCFRAGHEESVSLTRLAQLFAGHRLMIFGHGEALLDPKTAALAPGLARLLPVWEERALLTPLPVADWSIREKILRQYFAVLPADLAGQMDLIETWDDRNPPDFRTLQRKLLKERPEAPALMDYNFRNAAEIKAYLGERRFPWVAGALLYPRSVWELTLALAAGFETQTGGSGVTYEDLLHLSRLPWMHDGDLSETLRAEIVALLDREDELRAREILLRQIDQANVPPESFAAQERAIQLAVQQAMLNPGDPRQEAGLRLLLGEGMLDPLTRAKVKAENKNNRQRQSLRLAAVVLAVMSLGLSALSLLRPTGPIGGLTRTEQPDSLSTYVNLAGEALTNGDTLQARRMLDHAHRLDSTYAPARYQRAVLTYYHAKAAYQQRNWPEAERAFGRSRRQTQAADTVYESPDSLPLYQQSLHARGLVHFYIQNAAIAAALRDSLPGTFYDRFGSPNLLTLLGGVELDRQIQLRLNRADSLFEVAVQQENGSPEAQQQAWETTRQAYRDVLSLAPQNTKATTRLEEIRQKLAAIVPVYTLSGTVVDDSTGQPIAGAEVRTGQTTILTNAQGRFRFDQSPESSTRNTFALIVLATGHQRLDTTVNLPPLAALNLRIKPLPVTPGTVTLEGTLTETGNNQSIPGATVTVNYTTGTQAQTQTTTTNASGEYSFTLPANAEGVVLSITKAGINNEGFKPLVIDTRDMGNWRLGVDRLNLKMERMITPPPIPLVLPKMIRIPGGTFERDKYNVTVSDFWLGETEVTNAQYAAFLNAKGNQTEGRVEWINLSGSFSSEKCRIQKRGERFEVEVGYENHPVIYVSWYGSKAYCDYLSEQTGQRWRLPTEAEWEYAAGGGSGRRTEYAGTDDVNQLGQYAWYNANANSQTHPVRQKAANGLGLYDMSGNVWEWCSDWYADYPASDISNPQGPDSGSYRVNRGGSWNGDATYCRVAGRSRGTPGFRYYNVGFRPTRTN